MNRQVKIGSRTIGGKEPVFIMAEAGVNHNGDIRKAKELISAAASAGCDAVKFQTFFADEEMTKAAPKAEYQKKSPEDKETYHEYIKKFELGEEEHRELMRFAGEKKITFLSTPSEENSADLLERVGVCAFKIGSNDLATLPMLEYIARKGKPMILSTGMATLREVADAVRTVRRTGNRNIVLLHCTSTYPAIFEDANLRAMEALHRRFLAPVGYSDHTAGIEVTIAAAALGASVIEKHITLDKNLPGPDHRFSLEPHELEEMVRCIRNVEKSLGSPVKKPVEAELKIMEVSRKSVVARVDIPKGTVIKKEMLSFKRPATGVAPKFVGSIIGKKAGVYIKEDEIITWDMIK